MYHSGSVPYNVAPSSLGVIMAAIPAMVDGIHGAFSLAVAQTFYLGVAGAVIAVLAAVAIKEIPLRGHDPQEPTPFSL